MSLTLPPTKEFHDLSVQENRFFGLIEILPPQSRDMIKRAHAMAKEAHSPQMRDDGTPYILHPLRAGISLISECGITDPEILSAMLLHDVVEDTPISFEHIGQTFGKRVAQLVENVTRSRGATESEEQIRKNKEKKLQFLLESDEQTRLIKCADLLDNVRSWPNIPCKSSAQKKLPRWFDEVRTYALPLAQKTNSVLFQELSNAFSYAEQHRNDCSHLHAHSS